jgi:hypothetical protein
MTWDGQDYGWGLPRQRKLTDEELAERDRRLDLAMDTEDELDSWAAWRAGEDRGWRDPYAQDDDS